MSRFTNLINNRIPAARRVIEKRACLRSLSSMGYMVWTPHFPQVPLHPILNSGTAIQILQRPVSQFTGIPVISRTTKTHHAEMVMVTSCQQPKIPGWNPQSKQKNTEIQV